MIEADRVLLLTGIPIVALGLSSRLVKRHALSPVVLAMGVGVLVGPHALDVIDPTAAVPRGELLEQLCRVALALAVFDIALRTRPADLRANARRVGALLLVVMPGMWLLTSVGAGLLLNLSFPIALLLGAALTPTDPGVAEWGHGTVSRRPSTRTADHIELTDDELDSGSPLANGRGSTRR